MQNRNPTADSPIFNKDDGIDMMMDPLIDSLIAIYTELRTHDSNESPCSSRMMEF